MHDRYYTRSAAAYVRGRLGEAHPGHPLFTRSLDALSEADRAVLFMLGQEAGLKLHRFKRTMDLPRVRKVLGLLRGLQPETLLDVGTGRGVFLWPLLEAFPDLPVTCLDVLDYRVADLQAVARGGLTTVQAHRMDVRAMPFAEAAFDGVTLLETLEHIPDPPRVIDAVCRVARRFVAVSVPSKADTNPEHIHLFTADRLRWLFREAGMRRVQAGGVLNHLILLALR